MAAVWAPLGDRVPAKNPSRYRLLGVEIAGHCSCLTSVLHPSCRHTPFAQYAHGITGQTATVGPELLKQQHRANPDSLFWLWNSFFPGLGRQGPEHRQEELKIYAGVHKLVLLTDDNHAYQKLSA
jgi:hypothetical protein